MHLHAKTNLKENEILFQEAIIQKKYFKQSKRDIWESLQYFNSNKMFMNDLEFKLYWIKSKCNTSIRTVAYKSGHESSRRRIQIVWYIKMQPKMLFFD